MVNYRRNFSPGGSFFFTVTLADRRSKLLVDHVELLRDALRVARQERPFVIDAVVILPDHLHAIFMLPPGDSDFSGRWRRIKGHFSSALLETSMELKRRPNGSLALWQRRFWEHTIRDENDFARHVDYIHFNPVKHGLVQRVRDWPYSSFHRYVNEGILPDDWAGDAGQDNGANFGERERLDGVVPLRISRSPHERSDMREARVITITPLSYCKSPVIHL
jgi:putative transposase